MTENNFAETQHSAPILTLHPEQEARQTVEKAVDMLEDLKNAPQAPDAREAVAALDSSLTDEEKIQVAAFSKTIDLTNPDHVMLYGADAQKKISGFADTVLANVKTGDTRCPGLYRAEWRAGRRFRPEPDRLGGNENPRSKRAENHPAPRRKPG